MTDVDVQDSEVRRLVWAILDAQVLDTNRPSLQAPNLATLGAIRAYGNVIDAVIDIWGEDEVHAIADDWERHWK